MSKITLNDLDSLENETTALTTINGNSDTIQTAFDNTLSRDGTAPNQMQSNFDMNNYQIINLPAPSNPSSALRLADLESFIGGGTINALPSGGTTNQVLKKNSNTNYDVSWGSFTAAGGGALNSIQYNGASGLAGVTLSTGQVAYGTQSGVPTAGYPSQVDAVFVFGIDNTGVTNVSAGLQTAINILTAAGVGVYIKAGTYNLGNGGLTIPDYSRITCHKNAIFTRTADSSTAYGSPSDALIQMGNHCIWDGGVINNTVVSFTSSTSNTIGTGSKSWTVGTGLPITPGSGFLRVWSASNPNCRFEGTPTTYSGGVVTFSNPFIAGSGTFSDWNFNFVGAFDAPIAGHNITKSVIQNVRITGNWYVGIILEAVNPPTGGSLLTNYCTIRNCYAEAVQNRAFYLYGNCNDNLIEGCWAYGYRNGHPGSTDYGFNYNPANQTGNANAQLRNKTVNCVADGTGFQGFAIGDLCFYNTIANCTASNMTDPAGNGFVIQAANAGIPQYNTIANCTAHNIPSSGFISVGGLFNTFSSNKAVVCGFGFLLQNSTSPVSTSQYTDVIGCTSHGNSTGFLITGSSIRCSLEGVICSNNSSKGVQIDSGCSVTRASGRSYANGANTSGDNFTDNGTNTVQLLTTI